MCRGRTPARSRSWTGGSGLTRTPENAAKYCAGWNVPYVDRLCSALLNDRLDAACEAIGRDPATLERSVNLAFHIGATAAAADAELDRIRAQWGDEIAPRVTAGALTGTPDRAVDRIAEYREAGADMVNVALRLPVDADALDAYLTDVVPGRPPGLIEGLTMAARDQFIEQLPDRVVRRCHGARLRRLAPAGELVPRRRVVSPRHRTVRWHGARARRRKWQVPRPRPTAGARCRGHRRLPPTCWNGAGCTPPRPLDVTLHHGDIAPLALDRIYQAIVCPAGTFTLIADVDRAQIGPSPPTGRTSTRGARSAFSCHTEEPGETTEFTWRLRRTGTALDTGITYVAHEATGVDDTARAGAPVVQPRRDVRHRRAAGRHVVATPAPPVVDVARDDVGARRRRVR